MAADPSLDHDNPLAEVYEDQLNAADLVLLNKTDLLDEADLARVTAAVADALSRAVSVVPAREGRVDLSVLLGLEAQAEDDLAAGPRIMTRWTARMSMMTWRVSSSISVSSPRPNLWSRGCGRRPRRMTCCG